MKLYQLVDGTLVNLDQLCVLEQDQAGWQLTLASGQSFWLQDDDARNLSDQSLLNFEFMAE